MGQEELFAREHLEPQLMPGELARLKEECLTCTICKLSKSRTKTVFGVGAENRPPVAFVGEGPGRNEDAEGVPFVGKAGRLLDKMIVAMGLSREAVYICNVVNCRPPENRTPEPDEIAACSRFLTGQLQAVQPRVIVALGATAAHVLVGGKKPVGDLRRIWHEWRGIPLRVSYHPAFLLRNPDQKRDSWEDLQAVMKKLGDHVVAAIG